MDPGHKARDDNPHLAARRLPLKRSTWYNSIMIKVLEDAIEKVKKLPQERQAFAAELLEQFVADADAGVFEVPDHHMAGVHEGLEQARRGEFVGDDEMACLWKKLGL
jgi:predicted transcriptional regulator